MRIDSYNVGNVTAADKGVEHAKLVDAAQQFEAMLMQEMLKPLQSSENSWDKEDKDGDGSMDTTSSFGTESVAKAISKSGGLGIARKVVEQVTREHELQEKKNG